MRTHHVRSSGQRVGRASARQGEGAWAGQEKSCGEAPAASQRLVMPRLSRMTCVRRARQSRMKIAEGMTCAPVGNAAACVSVRPVHLRRHASQVCAHSSPRAHAARTTATGETEFFERVESVDGVFCLRTFGGT